jgi:hypothetical protein
LKGLHLASNIKHTFMPKFLADGPAWGLINAEKEQDPVY